MRHPLGARTRRPGASADAARTGWTGHFAERRFRTWRGLFGDPDLDRRAVAIAEPQSVAVNAGRRIDPFDALSIQMLLEPGDVVRKGTERQIVQRLARPFRYPAPAMRMTVRMQVQGGAMFAHVQSEQRVKPARRGEIRHGDREMIQRMHAERVGSAGGWNVSPDLRHLVSPGRQLGGPVCRQPVHVSALPMIL